MLKEFTSLINYKIFEYKKHINNKKLVPLI